MVMMLYEFIRGSAAVGLVLVGLQVIGVILAVALDTDDWFFLALGMAVALAVSGGVLWLAFVVSIFTLTPTVAGWLGMAVGRRPFMYGRDDSLFSRALGNLLLIAVFAWWGYGIWERAELAGDPFKSVAGLFVIAGGGLVGVLALVPLLYFAFHPDETEPGKGKKSKKTAGQRGESTPIFDQASTLVALLAVCTMTGMGLARCTAEATGPAKDSLGRILAPYGDFVSACVVSHIDETGCADPTRFVILPRGSKARRIRVKAWMSCSEVHVKDDRGTRVEFSAPEMERLDLPLEEPGSNDRYLVFDSQPGQAYTVEFGSGDGSPCRAGMTYVAEPTWLQQEASR